MLAFSVVLLGFTQCRAFSLRSGKETSGESGLQLSNAGSEALHDVFLFAGQSNCLGMGFQTDLPARFAEMPQSLRVWKGNDWQYDTWDQTALPGQFGPEVTFSYLLDEIYGPRHENFGLVKVSKIMTSLYNDWSRSNYKDLVGTDRLEELKRSTMRWEPGTKNFQPWLFADLIDSAQKALNSEACSNKCQVKALFWVQGESDAMDPDYADVYEAHFAKLVRILRKELQSPEMKVVVAGVAPDLNAMTFPATETVLKAQHAFVDGEGPATATFVSAANLEKMGDHLHYNSVGQLDLGKRLASAYLSMVDAA